MDLALIQSEALYCLKREQLVNLCKRRGIKPSGKTSQMADMLRKSIEAVHSPTLDANDSVVSGSPRSPSSKAASPSAHEASAFPMRRSRFTASRRDPFQASPGASSTHSGRFASFYTPSETETEQSHSFVQGNPEDLPERRKASSTRSVSATSSRASRRRVSTCEGAKNLQSIDQVTALVHSGNHVSDAALTGEQNEAGFNKTNVPPLASTKVPLSIQEEDESIEKSNRISGSLTKSTTDSPKNEQSLKLQPPSLSTEHDSDAGTSKPDNGPASVKAEKSDVTADADDVLDMLISAVQSEPENEVVPAEDDFPQHTHLSTKRTVSETRSVSNETVDIPVKRVRRRLPTPPSDAMSSARAPTSALHSSSPDSTKDIGSRPMLKFQVQEAPTEAEAQRQPANANNSFVMHPHEVTHDLHAGPEAKPLTHGDMRRIYAQLMEEREAEKLKRKSTVGKVMRRMRHMLDHTDTHSPAPAPSKAMTEQLPAKGVQYNNHASSVVDQDMLKMALYTSTQIPKSPVLNDENVPMLDSSTKAPVRAKSLRSTRPVDPALSRRSTTVRTSWDMKLRAMR